MNNYKYDIAISLCKQDAEFARKLVKAINPDLKIFFYEDRQEEIINKLGPEVFTRTFKDEARVVVILSRKEYGSTIYTDLENNAIVESFTKRGYNFLFVIPMVHGEVPTWYLPSRIYADPTRFTIDQLAQFIEFKVTEEGGTIKQLTLEDRYQHLLDKIEEKKKIVALQYTQDALDAAKTELSLVAGIVKQKVDLFRNTILGRIEIQTWPVPEFAYYFRLNDFMLAIRTFQPDELYRRIVTTQSYSLLIEVYKVNGFLHNLYDQSNNKELITSQYYKYLFDSITTGWCIPNGTGGSVNDLDKSIMFQRGIPHRTFEKSQFYDLKNPVSSEFLIDSWFQILLEKATNNLNRYL